MQMQSPYFSKNGKKRARQEDDESLLGLLAVPAVFNDAEGLQQGFKDLASALLNKLDLVVKAQERITRFRICELEVYYQSEAHADPFCHAREIQAHPHLFYFHRSGNHDASSASKPSSQTAAGGYRGGTRKGFDVTFGNDKARAGILIRTVINLETNEVICGPSKIVDTILALNKAVNIRSLIELYDGDVSILQTPDRAHDLYLELSSEPGEEEIYSSPRIGLDLARATDSADFRVQYIDKRYRFFIRSNLLKSAGRGQTFLGLYLHCSNQNIEARTRFISEKMGVSVKHVQQYTEAYETGLKNVLLEKYIGKKGNLSVSEWLKMAGALEKMKASLANPSI